MNQCVATVGTFDGVHKGHIAILDELKRQAAERGLQSHVITFRNHPLEVVDAGRVPNFVVSRQESFNRILDEGVDHLTTVDFDAALAKLTAREFMHEIKTKYNVAVLVMGFDNTFGSDRLKNKTDYRKAAKAEGLELVFVNPVYIEGKKKVSSSLLRQAIAKGDLDMAARLCDWPAVVEGTVERGKRNGHKLGFPTVNIQPDSRIESLPAGVYIARWYSDLDEDGGEIYGVLNIGHNPTIGDGNKLTYEFHAPGINLGERYGEKFAVDVLARLRDERKFDSLAELKHAIRQDINSMYAYLVEMIKANPAAADELEDSTMRGLLKYINKK